MCLFPYGLRLRYPSPCPFPRDRRRPRPCSWSRTSLSSPRRFADGAEAWTHLSANLADYELLVIDVNLPGMNGLDMVGRAREREFGGRVLMMSGRFATADLRAVARLKVDQAITKPFTAAQFESVVREALNGAARKTAGI